MLEILIVLELLDRACSWKITDNNNNCGIFCNILFSVT